MNDTKLKVSKTHQKSIKKWIVRIFNIAKIAKTISDNESTQKHKNNKVTYRKKKIQG